MTSPWVCDSCKKPISSNDGFIELVNLDPDIGDVGGLPRAASDDDDLIAGPKVGVVVYHGKGCDPRPAGTQGYVIDVGRARTPQDWMAWVDHVCDKTWLSRGDVARVLRFWFKNRDLPLHQFGP